MALLILPRQVEQKGKEPGVPSRDALGVKGHPAHRQVRLQTRLNLGRRGASVLHAPAAGKLDLERAIS